MVNAPLPPRRRAGWRIFCFHFFPPKYSKEQFLLSLGPQKGRGNLGPRSPSPLTSERQWAFEECYQTYYWPNAGKYLTHSRHRHSDPASDWQRDARAGSLRFPSLPHHGYVGGPAGAACALSGGLNRASQFILLAPPDPQIRLGYAIQFARRAKFRGIHFTSMKAADAPVLRAEIATLLAKDAIEPVPPADMRMGFYSPYFIVPKKGEQGICILNYLDDWLILAQSQDQLCEHRDLVLAHLSRLGLRVNWEKSKLSPTQRISFLGMELDSVEQTARLTQECAQSVLNYLNTFKCRTAVPLKLFQRLLGHMATAAAVTLLGLLHMRPLQHWLHGRVPRRGWQRGTHRVKVTPACHQTFIPWSDPMFLRAGVPLEQVSRHAVVHTDTSTTGWGATYDGQAVSGVWTGPQLHWHINCLELLAVCLALRGVLRQAHAGPHGQHCDHCVHQPTRWSTLPSHVATHLPPPLLESEAIEVQCHSHSGLAQPFSRRAVTSCAPRRIETPSPVGPADLETFRGGSGRPVCLSRNVPLPVVLFPDRGNTRHGRTGTQLAVGPAQVCVSPSEPSRTDIVQDQGGRGAGLIGGTLLAHPDLVPRTNVPRDSPSLADSSEEGSTDSLWHPRPDLWKLRVWSLDGMRMF
ncbi:Protein P [Labeo rohita]|uniref:ribonuclease H n=1 Tax=Labeo rohita TaxID=84645 RepID=A0ABQ8MU88_LABRO|nr:Protein P [Labeo rohita]